MSERRYITPARFDGLPGDVADARSTPGPSSTAAYADHTTPYSAVSSFNQPAICDTTLLTPVSVAGSPPTQHRTKLIRPYPSNTPNPQQPTPPASSRMHWSQYPEMTAPSSQSGSPMMMHPPVSEAHFDIDYITTDPSTPIKDESQPPEPYFGSYGVSEQPEPEDPVPIPEYMNPQYYMHYPMEQVHPSVLTMDPEMHHRPLAPAPAAPILSQPHPDQFRGQHVKRQSREDFNVASMPSSLNNYQQISESPKSRRAQSASRITKRPRYRGRQDSMIGASASEFGKSMSGAKHSKTVVPSQREETPEPLQLKDSIPEDDRFLFESLQKHRGDRGKGMWESIMRDYNMKFGGESAKAALQMKLTRGKTKWIVWSDKDLNALRRAFMDDEQERYKRLLTKFKENGGGRTIDFNTTNIEAKLAELGLEDMYMEAEANVRRRKKTVRRTSVATSSSREEPMYNLQKTYSHGSLMHDNLTDEKRDEMLDQILERRGYDDYESDSQAGSETGEAVFQDGLLRCSPDGNVNMQHSARIAKQACEEIQKASQHKGQAYMAKHNSRQMA